MSLDFINRIKGTVTQTLLRNLLSDAGYRVVPLGVEEVLRELADISEEQYKQLNLALPLRKLPDFFVSNLGFTQSWLVEAKYRKSWNEQVRAELHGKLFAQVETWQPLILLIVLGESPDGGDWTCSFIRTVELSISAGELYARSETNSQGIPWLEIDWADFDKIQITFAQLSDTSSGLTIQKTVDFAKQLKLLGTKY